MLVLIATANPPLHIDLLDGTIAGHDSCASLGTTHALNVSFAVQGRDRCLDDMRMVLTTHSPDSSQPEHATTRLSMRNARLCKHADYQKVYKASRKHFSTTMAYFYALRVAGVICVAPGPRVGLTAGKVLGNAVERNRIKRKMREAVRHHVALLHADVDIILHPRKTILTMDSGRIDAEVERIFTTIQESLGRDRLRRPATDASGGQG